MTYNSTNPPSTTSPKDSASLIQTNFSQFDTIFSNMVLGVAYNHVALNDFNEGKHAAIIFQRQTTDPTITQNLDVLYCKNATAATGTTPQLFLRIPKFLPTILDPSKDANNPMQITYNSVNTAGPVYQSFLAGGYILYFGTTSNIAVNITLSPSPTKILVAIAEPNNLTTSGTPTPFSVSTQIISTTQFKINSNATGVYSFTWMAIGTV